METLTTILTILVAFALIIVITSRLTWIILDYGTKRIQRKLEREYNASTNE